MFDKDPREWLLDFFRSIPREDIERFIDSGYDLVPLLKDKLEDVRVNMPSWVMDFVIGLLRKEWKNIESFLSDTDKVIKELVRLRPELAVTFAKKHRREWLEKQLMQIREFLYHIAWEL